MTNNLLTPILNDRTRSVNFFNGRLLTGEDLTAEQQANQVAHKLLGQAVGSGVAYGLEVSESTTVSGDSSPVVPINTVASPVLRITQGLAINPNGGMLLLGDDVDISLVRPASTTTTGTVPASLFEPCTPMQTGVYIAGAGVYLLTIGPASSMEGLTEVSGVSTIVAPCNSKYKKDGVQFRLVQLDLTDEEKADVDGLRKVGKQADLNHLRNLVAYRCFGVADWAADVADPFGTHSGTHGLIDQLRAAKTITGCEVPLAVLYWTATDGIVFVDMWSVRRALVSKDLLDTWAPGAGRRRFVEGLAMFLQFETQINDLIDAISSQSVLGTIDAAQYFHYLPPAGILPIAGTASLGLDPGKFFFSKTFRGPLYIEGAKVGPLMHSSFSYPAVDLTNKEMVWLYWVRENLEPGVQPSPSTEPYVIFTNGHVPFQALAQFDLNYWNYANFI